MVRLAWSNVLKLIEDTKILYKYKTFSDYTLDSIKNKYWYFSRPAELNDPFDGHIPNDYDCTEEEFNNWARKFNMKYDDSISFSTELIKSVLSSAQAKEKKAETKNHYHILSLTSEPLSESMWAYYAKDYNGLCIGYKVDTIIENERLMIKTNSACKKELTPYPRNLGSQPYIGLKKIDYIDKITKRFNIFKGNKKVISEILFSKKKNWISENEYRCVITDSLSPNLSLSLKLSYPDEVLSEIIFGYKAKDKDIKEVIDIVQSNYTNANDIFFYRAEPDYENMTLRKIKIC